VERLRDLIDAELLLLYGVVDFLLPSQTAIAATHQDFGTSSQQFLGILPMGELPPIPVRVAAAIGDGRVIKLVELQNLLWLHPRHLLIRRRTNNLVLFPD
jgi:hypothetical protein